MKNEILFISLLLMFLGAGCFEDDGNYTYRKLEGPTWLIPENEFIYASCYEGETATARSLFRFDEDSVAKLANCRYEWTLNGKVISGDRNLSMPTETLMAKAGLEKYPESSIEGYFIVIDKTSGLRYMKKVSYLIRPKYFRGDWLILSENGDHSKLSFMKRKVAVDRSYFYEFQEDIYKNRNGEEIAGKPLHLRFHLGKNISASAGATTIITDHSFLELNNETMEKAHEVEELFLDGLPASFEPVDAFYKSDLSYIATKQGQLYRRVMSENWLGGKYISEPYPIDNKGYSITWFGASPGRGTGDYCPCYDELNRRVVMLGYSTLPVVREADGLPVTVWEMEEGTEMLYVGVVAGTYTMIYNREEKTYVATFKVNNATLKCTAATKMPFPGGHLEKGTLFLSSSTPLSYGKELSKVIIYTKGNELRYYSPSLSADYPLMTFRAPVTALRVALYNFNYKQIAVGLANGDFMMVDISNMASPQVYESSRINLGGRIADVSEIRNGIEYDLY